MVQITVSNDNYAALLNANAGEVEVENSIIAVESFPKRGFFR